MARSRIHYALWPALSACILSGCGGADSYEKAVVTGRVMCGDKPAWGGYITFEPIDAPDKTGRPEGNPGGRSVAQVDKDGNFRLTYEARGANSEEDGAVIGPHEVAWTPPQTEPRKWSAQDNWLPEEEKAKLKAEMAAEPVYPKLNCGLAITPSQVEVQPGENNFAFTLEETARAPRPAVEERGSDIP
jgi:hypothetical protein